MAVNILICQVKKHQNLLSLENESMQTVVKIVKNHLTQLWDVPSSHKPSVMNKSSQCIFFSENQKKKSVNTHIEKMRPLWVLNSNSLL